MLEPPNDDRLEDINDASVDEFPDLVLLEQTRDQPQVEDVYGAGKDAADTALQDVTLGPDAEVAITAGSRGIHDMPEVLLGMVDHLKERGYTPIIVPSMGSHGGATAEGQVEMLESLGITEEAMGCEIRSSLAVEEVGQDAEGRPIYAARDALKADAVLLANRVKLHTDFRGSVESGLCKMTVIGLGKQRGADITHQAGLAKGLDQAIPERAAVLFEETPIVGGVAIYENANERAAHVEGIPVEDILEREPELLDASEELFPRLPVENLDLLIVDEIGKNISGTGMDTNVVGRMLYHGQSGSESPVYTRIYVRGLTEASHHNAIGMGLADFIHADAVSQIGLTDTYINAITGGEPARARLPVVTPTDEVALLLTYSATGCSSPGDMRIGFVENTLDLGRFLVSENVAEELEDREDIELLDNISIRTYDGDFAFDLFEE
ncbi:DUF362 domain-containing protein [Halorussus sp. AFM4]|uniref:DUF362 domain-containing protein n=1 Tax=Halorussus sp. AFM4 TaxID=3421651 RepID=UPI003EC0CA54